MSFARQQAAKPSDDRVGARPYLFSYDITCPRRSYRVLKTLRRWRVDGQLSVHQTLLRATEVKDLAVELLELVSREEDSLFVGRLNTGGAGPVFQLFRPGGDSPLLGPYLPAPIPKKPWNGCYLVAYDVSDPRRLQRVQRVVAKNALFLQRSVYLYQGKGNALRELVDSAAVELDRHKDDLRLYSLTGPRDLWYLTATTPPIPEIPSIPRKAPVETDRPGLWAKLMRTLAR